jgi:hypothetical protein
MEVKDSWKAQHSFFMFFMFESLREWIIVIARSVIAFMSSC